MATEDANFTEPTDSLGRPLRNLAVVEAMRNVSLHDAPSTRALLFELLLQSQLVAMTPERPESSGTRIARAGETLELVNFADDDGAVLPLFTSVATLQTWQHDEVGYVVLPARTFFEMAALQGTSKIVLDHGSPTWGLLTRNDIEQLARGRLPLGDSQSVVAESTEVRIGRPAVPPAAGTLDALRIELDAQPAAEQAWYFLMQQVNQEPETCIAIRFAPTLGGEERQPAMQSIMRGAAHHSDGVQELTFLVADDEWRDALSDGSGELFFSRQGRTKRWSWFG